MTFGSDCIVDMSVSGNPEDGMFPFLMPVAPISESIRILAFIEGTQRKINLKLILCKLKIL